MNFKLAQTVFEIIYKYDFFIYDLQDSSQIHYTIRFESRKNKWTINKSLLNQEEITNIRIVYLSKTYLLVNESVCVNPRFNE